MLYCQQIKGVTERTTSYKRCWWTIHLKNVQICCLISSKNTQTCHVQILHLQNLWLHTTKTNCKTSKDWLRQSLFVSTRAVSWCRSFSHKPTSQLTYVSDVSHISHSPVLSPFRLVPLTIHTWFLRSLSVGCDSIRVSTIRRQAIRRCCYRVVRCFFWDAM